MRNDRAWSHDSTEDADVVRSIDKGHRARRSDSETLIARAIAFAALLFSGVGALAIVAFSDINWVYPVSAYGLFLVWAKREFF